MIKKIIISVLIGIPVILIGIVVYFTLNLNSIVKEGVETIGPKITKSEVRLGSSNISIFDGKGSLNNIFIGNPKGFTAPSVFELGSVDVALDMKSITKDTIIIKKIFIDKPKITLELGKNTTNINQLMKNVESFSGPSRKSKRSETKAAGSKSPQKKIIIREFTISHGQINVMMPLIEKNITTPLPKLVLKDIGKDQNGVTVENASILIMEAVEKAVMAASADPVGDLKSKLGNVIEDQKAGVIDKIKEKSEGLGDAIKGLFD